MKIKVLHLAVRKIPEWASHSDVEDSNGTQKTAMSHLGYRQQHSQSCYSYATGSHLQGRISDLEDGR